MGCALLCFVVAWYGRHFPDDILNTFSWMEMYELRLRFHWSLFLRVQLAIFHHWFRLWLGACQATSHYLIQLWLVYWRIYASLGLNELSAKALYTQMTADRLDLLDMVQHKCCQNISLDSCIKETYLRITISWVGILVREEISWKVVCTVFIIVKTTFRFSRSVYHFSFTLAGVSWTNRASSFISVSH